MQSRRVGRYIVFVAIFLAVLWTSFCVVTSGGMLWVVNNTPSHGDDGGAILCFTIPLTILVTWVIMRAFDDYYMPR